MKQSVFDVVNGMVSGNNYTGSKIIKYLAEKYPDKIVDYGAVMCLYGLCGDKLENFFIKYCQMKMSALVTTLDTCLKALDNQKEKVLK